MKEAKISEIKNQLSRYLALVRRGEVVRILDRNVPIAQIVPIQTASSAPTAGAEVLADLERKGLIRRGTARIAPELLRNDPPGKPVGALEALLEERRSR
jgi:prevent-host-death family protein